MRPVPETVVTALLYMPSMALAAVLTQVFSAVPAMASVAVLSVLVGTEAALFALFDPQSRVITWCGSVRPALEAPLLCGEVAGAASAPGRLPAPT